MANEGLNLTVLPAHTDLADTVGGRGDGVFTDKARDRVLVVLWNAGLNSANLGRHASNDSLIASWSAALAGSNVDIELDLNRPVPGWVVGIAPGVGEIGITFC